MAIRRPRGLILSLLAGFVLIGLFTIWQHFSAELDPDEAQLQRDIVRYSAIAHDGATFAKLLHLRNGDPKSRVYRLLTRLGIVEYDIFKSDFRSSIQVDLVTRPERYPEGVFPGDILLEVCCVQPGNIYLQVRDAKLVNYSAKNYLDLLEYK